MSLLFTDPATSEIYSLSLHDALPIWIGDRREGAEDEDVTILLEIIETAHDGAHAAFRTIHEGDAGPLVANRRQPPDRKSTRLNSSHGYISYAVFCLKKKTNKQVRQAE